VIIEQNHRPVAIIKTPAMPVFASRAFSSRSPINRSVARKVD
jgi:hypothetical protein